jgi:hypothetical protein
MAKISPMWDRSFERTVICTGLPKARRQGKCILAIFDMHRVDKASRREEGEGFFL